MEKEQIESKLKQKFNDEYTIKMFTNFVMEFQECFEDIMPTEEVINRIKSNVFDNIKIVENFTNKELDGRYGEDGIVYLRKDKVTNEKYIKYLLFHELLHAITSVRDQNGTEVMMGFSYLKNSCGKGLNEAITEYLTQIRNEKFENDKDDLISGYRTVVEQMRRMIKIFGYKEIMHYYFYEPDKFKDFINSQGMNYDELEFAFTNLCGKDAEVYNIGNGKKLNNNSNYTVYRYSKIILDNYSNAIGEIDSLEKFENKYKCFQTYSDGAYDCISTILLLYYESIGKDVDKLLSKGVPFDKIKETLNGLNIRLDVLKIMYNFSKLFVQDKNKTATNLYEFYTKNPSLYFNIFAQNYAYIFEHFQEMNAVPDDKIYDAFRYPIIGALLKNQPQIDFSDISYYKIEEPKGNIHLYLFYTSDSKIYGYTANGKAIKTAKDEDNNHVFEVKINEYCSYKILYNKDGSLSYSITSTNEFDLAEYMKDFNFKCSHVYSEKSDIEYWMQKSNEEDRSSLQIILKKIEDRIRNRKGRNYED